MAVRCGGGLATSRRNKGHNGLSLIEARSVTPWVTYVVDGVVGLKGRPITLRGLKDGTDLVISGDDTCSNSITIATPTATSDRYPAKVGSGNFSSNVTSRWVKVLAVLGIRPASGTFPCKGPSAIVCGVFKGGYRCCRPTI